ncbi:MAG: hypothetical protein OXC92_09690 [Flavobacteriaceae bacterium]|nr:hypothetical protein [Flavobacteriaceae bacterium]
MTKPFREKRAFKTSPNHENIPLEWHLIVDDVMGQVFKKANIPSHPKRENLHSR